VAVTWRKLAYEDDVITKALLTAKGDIIYASAAGTPAALAIGADNHVLTVATDVPNWEAGGGGGAVITSGTYTGDNSVNRGMPHGLGTTPKLVIIVEDSATYYFILIAGLDTVNRFSSGGWGYIAVTAKDSTNFYVGDSSSYRNSANSGSHDYFWVAMG
jgi:hypothetical protein